MKVVMLSRVAAPFHGYGGMQQYITLLSQHLTKQGIEVNIVASLLEKGKKIEVKEEQGVTYTLLPPYIAEGLFPFWYTYHIFSHQAAKYLSALDFDILHSYGFPAFFYLLRTKRKPVVVQPFGSESFKARLTERWVNYLMWYPQSWYTMQKAEAIASEGEKQSQEIVDIYKVSGEKIFVLPDGVDTNKIKNYLEESKVRRENLGLQEGELVLINVNRLEENKGVTYLVDALPIIKRVVGKVRLIMVGTGSQEKSLKSQISSLGLADTVLHLKEVEESTLFGYFKIADIAVTPTLFEGLPIVLLEAMACGLPIVTTDISDNSKVVKNGENGYLVPPANSEAIAEAVIRIWKRKDMKRMGENSLKMVEPYDWGHIAKKAIEAYEMVISRYKSNA